MNPSNLPNRRRTSKKSYVPDRTSVFNGLRFKSRVSSFANNLDTYLTGNPNVIRHGMSGPFNGGGGTAGGIASGLSGGGDAIFDYGNLQNQRDKDQLYNFFDKMEGITASYPMTGGTGSNNIFKVHFGDYLDPFLGGSGDYTEKLNVIDGDYRLVRWNKQKQLIVAKKEVTKFARINKFKAKYFIDTIQLSRDISVRSSTDERQVIENSIGPPTETFSSFDFTPGDKIEFVNTKKNNKVFTVSSIEVDPIDNIEYLYLEDNPRITEEDLVGSEVVCRKLVEKIYNDINPGYRITQEDKSILCDESVLKVHIEHDGFGDKFFVNGKKRKNIVVGSGNKYTLTMVAPWSGTYPIGISSTVDGIHNGGTDYRDYTVVGNEGEPGSQIVINITEDTPDILYYYCKAKANMGGKIIKNEGCADLSEGTQRTVVDPAPSQRTSATDGTTTTGRTSLPSVPPTTSRSY